VSFLQCPQCHLTVVATAYYLRGDVCPRCQTLMEPYERVQRPQAEAPSPPEPAPTLSG
jgi:hypothetical protein